MPPKNWYIHLEGEVFGPFTDTLVHLLLRQNRLRFSDFAWAEGHAKWLRFSEIEAFQSLMPSYPKIPVPNRGMISKDVSKIPREAVPATLPRRKERVRIEAYVSFSEGETFPILNLSENGLLVELPSGIPLIGKEVRFQLLAPMFEKPLSMTGVLIREAKSGKENAVAIEFTKVNPAHARLIKSYVEETLKKAS